ncbi:Hypothetical predicted protein, partial [Paramuricea clavata]
LSHDTYGLACRAIWRVSDEDRELAKNQICSKRLQLDDQIVAMDGVQFFILCITMVETNADEDDEATSDDPTIFPGLAYFIVFRETSKCMKETIFAALHYADMEPTITEIKTRNTRGLTQVETAVCKIAQVVKDHNDTATKNMVIASNLFCRSVRRAREIEDENIN